ncbi:MAG: hypothetical protein JXA07_05070, partial [Spirochaetes bacterium]|nr:hypothetical protein [Spirochaetota bacterium]
MRKLFQLSIILIISSVIVSLTSCDNEAGETLIVPYNMDSGIDNVSGTIAPGEYLALAHNLDRNDLTFTGQFIKDGFIYDYTDYQDYFGSVMAERTGATVFASGMANYNSATTMIDGNILIAYEGSGGGEFVIYDSSGNPVAGPTVFMSDTIEYISATALNNGDALIAYQDYSNSHYGTFVIYNSAGSLVAG